MSIKCVKRECDLLAEGDELACPRHKDLYQRISLRKKYPHVWAAVFAKFLVDSAHGLNVKVAAEQADETVRVIAAEEEA